ncbi:hypothetical protein T492DRAFT_157226 [Pavlovales sp. CCMP2436]|nr:hypothetical protein T492DRAFT_157226 [Pavlovales sp. CCMP2436]
MYASLLCEGRMVVTNDEMRDHWLHLLDIRLFRRWKESQHIRFAFERQSDPSAWQIKLHVPGSFAHATQSASNGNWHIASDEGNSWLCIAPLVPVRFFAGVCAVWGGELGVKVIIRTTSSS